VYSKNSFAVEKPGTRIVGKTNGFHGAKAVTSMANVALVSIEPASSVVNGAQIMAKALDALARSNTEVLAFSSSSYRQSFCFLVSKDELAAALASLEANLSLELTHGYLRAIAVDPDVGLLAVVGDGMRGTPGLAGRIFMAISREKVNIIAIAQGSSESTIAIVVSRQGLETAVRAIHAECELSLAPPV
jgi:aspartokinase